jgi:hypothetical protein
LVTDQLPENGGSIVHHPELLASTRLLLSQLNTVEPKLAAQTIGLDELESVLDAVDRLRSTLWITFLVEESRARGQKTNIRRALSQFRFRQAASLLRGIRQDLVEGDFPADKPSLLQLYRAVEQVMWTLARLLGREKRRDL